MCALASLTEKDVSGEQWWADDKLSAVQETMLINKLCCFVVWVFFPPQNHEETLTEFFTIMLPTSVVKVLDITKARPLSQKEKLSSTNNNS